MYATELCNPRYAVIEARWIERPAERFAVGYYSEESLRELIVDSSIVGSGFISRQEALCLIPKSSKAAPSAASSTDANCESKENRGGGYPRTAEFEHRFALQNIWLIPGQVVHQLAAAFVLIACSKNVFSLAFRAFVGI
jgi:hypothetical protein